MSIKTNRVYLSLGSNLKDRKKNILDAYSEIEKQGAKILQKSSFFESPPWGFNSDQDFINSVILIETELSLLDLLKYLKLIERKLGRSERKDPLKYEDRLIDIDIIDYNGIVFSSDEITVPHDKMSIRRFVIYPLSEINPDWTHPISRKSINCILKELD